jgi:hypothetical protein
VYGFCDQLRKLHWTYFDWRDFFFLGKKMVWPQKNGFAVVYTQFLRELKDKQLAMKKADEYWRSLPQSEKDSRNKIAKEQWRDFRSEINLKKKNEEKVAELTE